jgi:hypothetical protein
LDIKNNLLVNLDIKISKEFQDLQRLLKGPILIKTLKTVSHKITKEVNVIQ